MAERRRGKGRRSNGGGEEPGAAAPGEVSLALSRARQHAQAALAEAAACARALLDAASLAVAGAPAERAAPGWARALDALTEGLDPRSPEAASAMAAVVEALDAEIARWEALGRDDADARAVLRAFLTVREVLWELGLRGREQPGASGGSRPHAERPRRVQRVPLGDSEG